MGTNINAFYKFVDLSKLDYFTQIVIEMSDQTPNCTREKLQENVLNYFYVGFV